MNCEITFCPCLGQEEYFRAKSRASKKRGVKGDPLIGQD